jgi:hypothetical protein
LACGLCAAINKPIVTHDVVENRAGSLGCGYPNNSITGHAGLFRFKRLPEKSLEAFAMYYAEPTSATARELDLAAAMTRTAAAIISRQCNGYG